MGSCNRNHASACASTSGLFVRLAYPQPDLVTAQLAPAPSTICGRGTSRVLGRNRGLAALAWPSDATDGPIMKENRMNATLVRINLFHSAALLLTLASVAAAAD